MQQYSKQVGVRYTKLFAKGIELVGKPNIAQRRKFIEKSNEQNKRLLHEIANNDIERVNYIIQLSVADVYRLMDDHLKNVNKQKA